MQFIIARKIMCTVVVCGIATALYAQDNNNIKNNSNSRKGLTLSAALQRVEQSNPSLQESRFLIESYDGIVDQAGMFLNPELSIEAENILGSGTLRGVSSGEFSLSLAQTIQLGRKRSRAKASAILLKSVALEEFQVTRLRVFLDVTKAFIEALAIQEKAEATAEFVNLAEQSVESVKKRVAAGVSNNAELAKSRIALSQSKIEVVKATQAQLTAYRQLSSYWGNKAPDFASIASDLYQYASPPSLESVLTRAYESAAVMLSRAEANAVNAELEMAKSRRTPNLTIGVGAKYLNETGDTGISAGVSVPLPLFNRNQGAIAAATSRINASEAHNVSVLNTQQAALTEHWYTLQARVQELDLLTKEMLPQAQLAYDSSLKLFRQGRFSYLDLLDSQRTLFEQRMQQIDALASYHTVVAEVESILGTPLTMKVPTSHTESQK